MARRRPWRTHVVSLYRRTRHLLLRFLCLHEAAILAFGCDFSGPKIIYFGHGFSVCTSATAYSGTLFSSRWRAMEYRRCLPCARFIVSDDQHSKCVKCLGFSHVREAVCGISKCKFCENLRLKILRSRLEVLEKESSFSKEFSLSRPGGLRSLSWVCDLGFGCWARGYGEWADRPHLFSPSLSRARVREFTGWICAWISLSQPGGTWHRLLRARWYTANSSLRGFRVCFSGCAPA